MAKDSASVRGQDRGIDMRALVSGCVAFAALFAIDMADAAGITARAAALPPEIPPAPYNWNGPFFGVSFGLTTGKSTQTSSVGDITPSFDLTGGVFGLALGYNWQAGKLLYGVDTDFSLSTKRGTSGYLFGPPAAPGPVPAGYLAETAEHWIATYRGRLGYVFDSWMVYVTGGGATADWSITATEPTPPGGPTGGIATESKTRWGWVAGLGVEAGRIHSFSVKAEYLYVDFGNSAYFNPPPLPNLLNRAGGVRAYDHIFRIGLNHKFSGF
jgi:outer membrane immunogenic protein